MTNKTTDVDKRELVRKLVAGFDVAMLVTRKADGGMRSRPLAIADKRDEATLYFSTSEESGKIDDIQHDASVNVVMQDGRRFVSLTGRATVVRDRALIHRLWSDSWKIWFPQGKDDPLLCLLVVEPVEAAYWDAGGVKGLKYLFEMARAAVTNTRATSDDDERHTGHVKL